MKGRIARIKSQSQEEKVNEVVVLTYACKPITGWAEAGEFPMNSSLSWSTKQVTE